MIKAYFDGACTENPIGQCACGIHITDGEGVLFSEGYYLGRCGGSNTAEYEGLIRVLEWLSLTEPVIIYGDSKLVINQMSGRWKIKKGLYKESALKAKALVEQFTHIQFKWIPREQNEICDELAEDAIGTWENENATFDDKIYV